MAAGSGQCTAVKSLLLTRARLLELLSLIPPPLPKTVTNALCFRCLRRPRSRPLCPPPHPPRANICPVGRSRATRGDYSNLHRWSKSVEPYIGVWPTESLHQSGCIRRRRVGPLKLKNSRRSMTSTMETIHTFLHESTTPVSQPCHMTAPGNRCSGGRQNGRVVSRPYRQKGTRQGFSLFDHHRVEPSAKFNKRTSPHPFNPDTALQHSHAPSAS